MTKIQEELNKIKTYGEFQDFLYSLQATIGTLGGRKFVKKSNEKIEGSLSLQEISDKYFKLKPKNENEGSQPKLSAIALIFKKNNEATKVLNSKETNLFQKVMTRIKQLFTGFHGKIDLYNLADKILENEGLSVLYGNSNQKKVIDDFFVEIRDFPEAKQLMKFVINHLVKKINSGRDEKENHKLLHLLLDEFNNKVLFHEEDKLAFSKEIERITKRIKNKQHNEIEPNSNAKEKSVQVSETDEEKRARFRKIHEKTDNLAWNSFQLLLIHPAVTLKNNKLIIDYTKLNANINNKEIMRDIPPRFRRLKKQLIIYIKRTIFENRKENSAFKLELSFSNKKDEKEVNELTKALLEANIDHLTII